MLNNCDIRDTKEKHEWFDRKYTNKNQKKGMDKQWKMAQM